MYDIEFPEKCVSKKHSSLQFSEILSTQSSMDFGFIQRIQCNVLIYTASKKRKHGF